MTVIILKVNNISTMINIYEAWTEGFVALSWLLREREKKEKLKPYWFIVAAYCQTQFNARWWLRWLQSRRLVPVPCRVRLSALWKLPAAARRLVVRFRALVLTTTAAAAPHWWCAETNSPATQSASDVQRTSGADSATAKPSVSSRVRGIMRKNFANFSQRF